MTLSKSLRLLILVTWIGAGILSAEPGRAQSLDLDSVAKQSYTGGILLTRDQCKQLAKMRKSTQLQGKITLSQKEIQSLGLKAAAGNSAEGCNGGLMD